MSKVEFKEFVKKNTYLIDYVTSGKTNWQKLYELYDLYGESSNIWSRYKETDTNDRNVVNNSNNQPTNQSSSLTGFKDLLNMVKGIDLNSVQKGLNSLDKAIDAFKGLVPSGNSTDALKTPYEPRPTYKYFED